MCTSWLIAGLKPLWSPADAGRGPSRRVRRPVTFSTVVDLTHVLRPDFPTYGGDPAVVIQPFKTWANEKVNSAHWRIREHAGTHLDAPIHFTADGRTIDRVTAEELVVPLAIVDISARAADDPDTTVTPDDIKAWESRHGTLPEGCCVAMRSGWDTRTNGPGYRNADEAGVMHFPAFHDETARFLIEERDVLGLGVDTLSIDPGPSKEMRTHRTWLPANRWAVEGLANLGKLPPVGATLVAMSPPVQGASGGPGRVVALV
ncbi:MAG: cyclase family protein [Geminicoccaceae bacterium]